MSEFKKVFEILSDEKYATNLSDLQDLVAIPSNDEKLGELVSNDKYKNQFSQLKYAVDILSKEKYSKNLSKLKDVVNILSNGQDLVKISSAQLVCQLSDEQYRDAIRCKRPLEEVMSEISRNAQSRGLTPEILDSILLQ